MRERRKIHRYQYQWGGQEKHWRRRVATTAVLLVVAAAVGWFAFDPMYALIMGVGRDAPLEPAGSAQPSSVPEQVSSAPESQSTAPVAPVPATPGLPERVYYLRPEVVVDPARLNTALQKIRDAGGNGVMFDLKDDKGKVLYRSDLPEVASYLTQSETAYDLTATLSAIQNAGLTPVGRLWTFQDSTATAATDMSGAAVKYMDSKVNWLDNAKASGGKAWLNPNSETARAYLLQLVDEVTQKGVDCLALDGTQFPTGFSLHLATYGGTPDRSAVLGGFLSEAKRVHGKAIYPILRLDAVAGVNDILYGTSPEQLAIAAGGVVLDVRPEQFGIGVTTERLTLARPLLTPYETVATALEQATATSGQPGLVLGALVQSYTSASVEGVANKTYGAAEAADQVRAANEAGIERIIYYDPSGNYPQ